MGVSDSSSHSCGLLPTIFAALLVISSGLVVSSGATHRTCVSGNEVRGVHLPLKVKIKVEYSGSAPPIVAAAVEIMFDRQTTLYRPGRQLPIWHALATMVVIAFVVDGTTRRMSL